MRSDSKKEKRRQMAASISFFSEAIRFIIIPLVLIELVINQFPLLTPEMSVRIANNLILFGGLVAIFSGLEAYFQRGTKIKMLFGLLSITTLCVWFWAIFSGGGLSFPYGPLNILIDASALVLLIIFAISLKGLHHIFRYLIAREELKQEEAKEQAIREKRRVPMRAVVADDAIHEPSFLYWYHEPEPPHPATYSRRCPVCLCGVSTEDRICPDCGAWIRDESKDYPGSSAVARDFVQ